MRRHSFGRAAALAVGVMLAFGACGNATTPPSASRSALPSASGVATAVSHRLGIDWQKVESVGAPATDAATPPPYENPNGLGHPMAYQGGQADIVDVVAAGSGFAAVGFLETAAGPRAAAWRSADGVRWSLVAGFPTADASVVRAVAAGRDGVVAVGADGPRPAAWHSTDGAVWQRSPQPLGAGDAEMSAVIATPGGYFAGGQAGTRAAFWTSSDGMAWERLPDSPSMSAARVESFARLASKMVAVGSALDGARPRGGAAWTSADGITWERVPARDLAIGPMHGVVATDDGFLAVGTNDAGTRAVVWSSVDGKTWQPVPDAESLDNHGLQIEMRDVARVGSGYVAVGHLLFGTQYPSGVIWSSRDGVTWTRAPDAPMFQQAKLFGITATQKLAVAVGTFGSPDFAIPTVWISPPR